MLVTRTKSNICVHTPSFSFKDIHTLLSDSKKANIFHRVRHVTAILRALRPDPAQILIPGSEHKVVIYYTSLRIIRSTFDDCKAVRSILRGFHVTLDERDVSMDPTFMEELRRALHKTKTPLTLPRVFIAGRYAGGAEEIRQLHESGELNTHLIGLARAPSSRTCEVCDGHGFILCHTCCGSHKCYSDKTGFRTCTACNVNGLIRCPSC